MKLRVYVLEATGLVPCKAAAASVYVKLKVGKHKARTRAVGPTDKPSWKEEFVFLLSDDVSDNAVLQVTLFCQFESSNKELLGRSEVPLGSILVEGEQSVPPTWYSLRPKHNVPNMRTKDCGKILLSLSLTGRNNYVEASNLLDVDIELKNSSSMDTIDSTEVKRSMDSLEAETSVKDGDSIKQVIDSVTDDDYASTSTTVSTFEEVLEIMRSSNQSDALESFQGDVVVTKTYIVDVKDLNSLLFKPKSEFISNLREFQGITCYVEGPWTQSMEGDSLCVTRTISYTKNSTKFAKSVKTMEEQKYLKADGKNFAILAKVCTPEVPFGDCFEVFLLYKITPGPQIPSGEPTSKLDISYNVEFKQTTLMKGMIETSVHHGLKENFEGYADVLSWFVKSAESSVHSLDKDQLLAPLLADHQSNIELAIKYFCNFTIISVILMGIYVVAHIVLSESDATKGLEFGGLDLPDSFGELVTSGILILQMKRAFSMISHFVQARLRKGIDHHSFKTTHGDGWLLTVALIEGINLPLFISDTLDPYVMLRCNGMTKTSSVQLQTQDPQWNEVIQFDAMQDPPSVLDVELFNFDGPFDQQFSLGHAEINFLKHTASELADMWVPLEGKLAQACQSRLHLRVFLENTRGPETIKHYLTKMEKEVGKKLSIQSPHKNSAFQKLFGLPAEEYLIKDYSCSLKRKIPLQGRLFVSARVVGFYANLFGHKTRFFLLWEDVEDIQVVAPSLATIGSPALLLILKSGRGMEARHGAKSQDEEGRLNFMFHSFVSFNTACRTIKALWRSKAIEQRSKLQEEQEGDDKSDNQSDVTESGSSEEDVAMEEAYSIELPVHIESLMEIFSGSHLEMKIMSKVGCLDYSVSQWEAVRPNAFKRQVSYKYNRYMSIFGSEVIGTQLKSPSLVGNGWTINDVMSLHNVPFGDHFKVHLKYEIQCLEADFSSTSQCHVYVGVEWLNKTKFKKRITKNIFDKLAHRSKEIFELAERELASLT
ncbi:C2 and GRAM domain-containing protein [Rhynchospora pubera]|uniref:C2 and GRAM domain-containing protein n=1 Tax=Rhynchospora pubera TaxID=906938 RepID=A0AAV8HI39_9POAL|nr:C2 and GRAM domain-containing protein [Rhynchospora pubera]